ncbi:MAG: fatty acid desaturase [Oligoflexales bacterium]|nr:fatty acid desaturase [Oligoflexales bacterium]
MKILRNLIDIFPIAQSLVLFSTTIYVFLNFANFSAVEVSFFVVLTAVLQYRESWITHHHSHLPFFRSEKLNFLYNCITSINTGIPMSWYKFYHYTHHENNVFAAQPDEQFGDDLYTSFGFNTKDIKLPNADIWRNSSYLKKIWLIAIHSVVSVSNAIFNSLGIQHLLGFFFYKLFTCEWDKKFGERINLPEGYSFQRHHNEPPFIKMRYEGKFIPDFVVSTLRPGATARIRAKFRNREFSIFVQDFAIFLFWSGLAIFNFKALLFYILPVRLIVDVILALDEMGNHLGCDTCSEKANSMSCYNPIFNWLTYNGGLHMEHHYIYGLHWSKLQSITPKLPPKDERSIAIGALSLAPLFYKTPRKRLSAHGYFKIQPNTKISLVEVDEMVKSRFIGVKVQTIDRGSLDYFLEFDAIDDEIDIKFLPLIKELCAMKTSYYVPHMLALFPEGHHDEVLEFLETSVRAKILVVDHPHKKLKHETPQAA